MSPSFYGEYHVPSSIIKTGRHDIAEILLKMALNPKNQSIIFYLKVAARYAY